MPHAYAEMKKGICRFMMSMGDVSKLLRTLESSKPFIIALRWVCAVFASPEQVSDAFQAWAGAGQL